MSEDKSSNTNGANHDPMQRLASFKPPRDLTLGGIKTSKKVFTPNLNVTRNKNKGPNIQQNNQKKEEKERKDKKIERNKNFRNGPNIIKSSGVFSEGLGNVPRSSSRSSYNRESDSVQTMQRPTIRVKDVVKIDKELEEQKIKAVLGDMDDDDQLDDFDMPLEKDAPIKLPMGDGGRSQVKPTVKVKREVVIKMEPEDPDSDNKVKPPNHLPDVKEAFERTDVVNLLTSEEPTLIFLKLPDALPGRGGKREDEAPRRKVIDEEPSTSTGEGRQEKPPEETRCTLADLEEGRIGKLRIHRSGRVTMLIGDAVFEVNMGMRSSMQEGVVSMATSEESRSANLIALGPMQHRLNIIPCWENLFKEVFGQS